MTDCTETFLIKGSLRNGNNIGMFLEWIYRLPPDAVVRSVNVIPAEGWDMEFRATWTEQRR